MSHPAKISWRRDTPVADAFDEAYFSLENGADETRHVFLSGNGLPQRLRDGFHVGELGFGTGLNLVCLLHAWAARQEPGQLLMTSFEAQPVRSEHMARALNAFEELAPFADALLQAVRYDAPFEVGPARVEIILGDAREKLPAWPEQADAWFLDGFSPAKNPQLWEAELLASVFKRTRRGGTFATYTAAGQVRRDLAEAGFRVERCPGYGAKRHMSAGRKP